MPEPHKTEAGQGQEVEARVAEAVARGDCQAGATALIQGYGPQVLGYLRSVIRDDEEADDAFALFAENVWKGLPGWEGRSSARAWAYRVAWNAASRQFRDPWHRRRKQLASSVASRLAAVVMTSSRRDLDRQQGELEQLRSTLTREEQSLLVLRVDRDLPWQEVAVALGAPDDAAGCAALRKRFERLKEKLAGVARSRGLI
jgi:RNA polymerase sigma-70 factor (ECF subfamily)